MNILHTTIKVFATLSLTLSSCANMNDSSIDLGDGYFYSNSKWTRIGSNSYYDTSIYAEITDYNFNNRYIIAKQIPDYEHHKLFIAEDLESRYMIYCSYLKDSTSKTFYNETTPFIRKAISADSTLYRQLKAKHITNQNSIEDKQGIQAVLDSVFHYDPYYIRLLTARKLLDHR